MNHFIEEKNEIFSIFKRIKNKDFSGNSGQAIKNSIYQFSTSLVSKFGSLIFTIILARLLLPELFGLYSLALSTIVIFSVLSDLGIGSTLITFVSKNLGSNKPKKAKAYFVQLFKWKIVSSIFASFILILSAYYISNIYYSKPIFLALLAGALYIPIVNILGFLESIFVASNLFKYPFYKEILFQILRITVVPISIFLIIKTNISSESLTLGIILIISLCYFLVLTFLLIYINKKIKFLRKERDNLTKKELVSLKNFLLPLTATSLSGIFFGYVDTIMLGHYVSENFIAYYGAAFALISSASVIISFTGIALLPIFARLKDKILEAAFRQTLLVTSLIGIVGAIFTFLIAKYIIFVVYGADYEGAIMLLRYFSILIIFLPLSTLYTNYFISQEKTKFLSFLLIFITLVNIILNYFFITSGLRTGMEEAVIGACIATLISRGVFLAGLGFWKRFN